MYNGVIPDYSSDNSEGATGNSATGKVQGSISLFEVGKRVMEGKGV